ncbi:hypothetical protein EBA05_01360 [Xanthomonas oryzae pv. oryzae]|nr:hypothetical protein C0L90_01360 [Xanthomonas oryzae pv. oryzae]QBI14664.1 hypothetical protein EYR03_01360 [Xanthomonas oryzae pv. oryzae]QBN26376.1 hypothetical protein EBA00_20900 [Xanthomonas oryzae pv. oryzae]QBN37941.1 hypothetical protein EBA04_01360 [Xanthomonas oryzae pv. oryzae]QBN41616.1 hypothetical protein EBA05_01360 [Xanthomonas oryzae pv. oryzae]
MPPHSEQIVSRICGALFRGSLKTLLDLHGHHVDALRTSDPGTVVYQDDGQVIAKPYEGQCV